LAFYLSFMQPVVMEGLAECEFSQAKVIMHQLSTSRLCGPCFTRLKVGHRRILETSGMSWQEKSI
jgi:hypothetical protein